MISKINKEFANNSLITNGEGLFEKRFSPKIINSIGNKIIIPKTYGIKE